MSKLPVVSGKACVKVLEKIGFFIERQRGSHIIMKRLVPPPSRTVVVPNHRELAKGTLRDIINQSGLTVEEFIELL